MNSPEVISSSALMHRSSEDVQDLPPPGLGHREVDVLEDVEVAEVLLTPRKSMMLIV